MKNTSNNRSAINMFLLVCGLSLGSFGYCQFNPVINLDMDQWYVVPNNYFSLSWEPPEPSLDTLLGFNIYRESDFYAFTGEYSLYHTPSGSNSGEDFLLYNNGDPFTIYVAAVYNSGMMESEYNFIQCWGFAVGVNESFLKKSLLTPNPTKGIIHLKHNGVNQVDVFNLNGQMVFSSQNSQLLDLSALPKGVYLVRMNSDWETTMEKIILE